MEMQPGCELRATDSAVLFCAKKLAATAGFRNRLCSAENKARRAPIIQVRHALIFLG
jgi:hypothetical protein